MMTSGEHIQGIEARYRLYGLDERARSSIKQLWPTVAPRLDEAVDAILDATMNLPRVSEITARHKDLIKKLEVAHLKALLSGDLGSDYFTSCRKTVEQEATLGLDARFRSTAGNYLLLAALKALASKHRYILVRN